jgi:hypothetical protein
VADGTVAESEPASTDRISRRIAPVRMVGRADTDISINGTGIPDNPAAVTT